MADIERLLRELLADDPTRNLAALVLPAEWRELLVDVDGGLVADDEDCTPLLTIENDEHVPVGTLVWAMGRAGLIRQPGEGRRWAPTELGAAVLEELRGEAGAP